MIRFILCAVCVLPIFIRESRAAERNIVLVVTDDQSLDAGCYGNPVIQTPHLDSVARDGTVLTHAFCTTASCSASRSVILTGLHNHANGHYGHKHNYHKFSSYTNISSLPVYLAKAGYRTARCGKYHVAPESVYQFQTTIGGHARNPVEMANYCEAFISAESNQPFFLYFCTADPHRSNKQASEIAERPNRFGNPNPGDPGYPGITEVTYDPDAVVVPGFLPDTPTCRAEMAQYYQSISRVDQGLGRLIQILRETNHWDRTLFVFISDHGIAMPGAKTTLYEGGMRSPCIVRNPDLPKRGTVCEAMVSWVDITPTILDYAGALNSRTGRVRHALTSAITPPPKGSQQTRDTSLGELHGKSFLHILDEQRPSEWNEVYASHTFHEIQMYYPMRVVRNRKYKLIWNIAHPLPFPFASDLWSSPTWQAQYQLGMDAPFGAKTVGDYIHRHPFELYDLEADPHEGHNLADDPQHADLLETLKAKLIAFQRNTNDPWIIKWDYE